MKLFSYSAFIILIAINLCAQDFSHLKKYAGERTSSLVLNDSLLNPKLKKLLGNDYDHFKKNLFLTRGVNLIEGNIVIDGRSQWYESEPAILVVDLKGGNVFAALGTDSKIIVYADKIDPENYTRLPESMRQWIDEVNTKLIMRPKIPANVVLFYSSEQKLGKDRDGIISDLNNLGAMAQQYYRKPKSVGGGDGSFKGWVIPSKVDTTHNGIYTVIVNDQTVVITGTGNKMKDNRSIQHSATVDKSTIRIVKDN